MNKMPQEHLRNRKNTVYIRVDHKKKFRSDVVVVLELFPPGSFQTTSLLKSSNISDLTH